MVRGPFGKSAKILLLAGAVLALGVGGAFFFLPPLVTVAEVSVQDIGPAVQGVGTVEAKVVVQIAAKITGRIVSLSVDQGDVVKTGQVLVRLDEAQLQAEVSRAEAALRAAEAQLNDLLAGSRPEEIAQARADVARAKAQLDDLLAGSRTQEIEELRERHKSGTATRVLAERELARARQLFAKELIAAQEVDRARQAQEVALAQERAAQQILLKAVEGARKHEVEAARAQALAAQHRLDLLLAGPRPHQVEAARAQAREARSALVLARARLEDAVIRSPLHGYVLSRELEPGATVNPGTPILKLADPRTAWVTVYVDEREIGTIAVGDAVAITLRSDPGRALRGRVGRVQRESDRVTEQLAVDLTFEERPPRITIGEQAEATIQPAGRPRVAMPLAALVRKPDGPGAITVANGRLRFRGVRLGPSGSNGWVEVVDGVRQGERVVLAPGRLADPGNEGRRVRVALWDGKQR